MAVSVPALRVRQRQPTRKTRQFTVFSRPKDQMPMVPQYTIGQQPRVGRFDRFEAMFKWFISVVRPSTSESPRLTKSTFLKYLSTLRRKPSSTDGESQPQANQIPRQHPAGFPAFSDFHRQPKAWFEKRKKRKRQA
jgi:hypothetical protein